MVLLWAIAVLAGGCTLIFTGEAFFTPQGGLYIRPFWYIGLVATVLAAALAFGVGRLRRRRGPAATETDDPQAN